MLNHLDLSNLVFSPLIPLNSAISLSFFYFNTQTLYGLIPYLLEPMEIISFIEDEEAIKDVFKHLGLLNVKSRLSVKTLTQCQGNPYKIETHIDYRDSQFPTSNNYLYLDEQNL